MRFQVNQTKIVLVLILKLPVHLHDIDTLMISSNEHPIVSVPSLFIAGLLYLCRSLIMIFWKIEIFGAYGTELCGVNETELHTRQV